MDDVSTNQKFTYTRIFLFRRFCCLIRLGRSGIGRIADRGIEHGSGGVEQNDDDNPEQHVDRQGLEEEVGK